MKRAKYINAKQGEELLSALKARFEKNMNRHTGLEWAKIAKLEANTEKLWSLNEMERTGGEPDEDIEVVCCRHLTGGER